MFFNEINIDILSSIKKDDIFFLNLNKVQKEKYLELYSVYRKWLTEYIIKILDLEKYDKEIGKIFFNKAKVKNEDMDFFQYFVRNILEYLYIRNDLYLDKLSDDDMKFLKSRILSNNTDYSNDIENYIKLTYPKIIFHDVQHNGNICLVFYGPNSSNYIAENNSIVIGLRYDTTMLNAQNKPTDFEVHDRILDNLQIVIEKIKNNAEKNISSSVAIIKYNDYSVDRLFNIKKH